MTLMEPSETGAKRSRALTALTRPMDTVLHHSETTGSHAETVGDGGLDFFYLPAIIGNMPRWLSR
ncbi:MAG: hypothetical protein LBD24_08930 [Spirochaetaceae bacterium]|nr:hypothetical protein [Spirochaetaceae bacterium]